MQAYNLAREASFWFRMGTLPTDPYDSRELDGCTYCKVERFETRDDLTSYLQTLFSEELINSFFEDSSYIDIDGKLYCMDANRGSDITKGEETYSVSKESDTIILLKVTVELLDFDEDFNEAVVGSEVHSFQYELLDGKWVFTDFPSIR